MISLTSADARSASWRIASASRYLVRLHGLQTASLGLTAFDAALAVFEHILTISQEISFVWRWRNLTRFTIFLLLLRYSILAYAGVSVASIFVTKSEVSIVSISDSGCDASSGRRS